MTHRSRSLSSPRGFLIIAVICAILIALPLVALVIRVPWTNFWSSLSSDAARTALFLSARTSLISTSFAIITGLPLAWLLAHRNFPGIAFVRALCVLPMVLPPVVGGVALLYAFGTKGLIGSALNDWWGIRLGFTQTAAILAQYFVAVPFFIVVMESAFQQFDQRLAQAGFATPRRPFHPPGSARKPTPVKPPQKGGLPRPRQGHTLIKGQWCGGVFHVMSASAPNLRHPP